jgi:hypothetical protein
MHICVSISHYRVGLFRYVRCLIVHQNLGDKDLRLAPDAFERVIKKVDGFDCAVRAMQ